MQLLQGGGDFSHFNISAGPHGFDYAHSDIYRGCGSRVYAMQNCHECCVVCGLFRDDVLCYAGFPTCVLQNYPCLGAHIVHRAHNLCRDPPKQIIEENQGIVLGSDTVVWDLFV